MSKEGLKLLTIVRVLLIFYLESCLIVLKFASVHIRGLEVTELFRVQFKRMNLWHPDQTLTFALLTSSNP
jgi:hypothetical protein